LTDAVLSPPSQRFAVMGLTLERSQALAIWLMFASSFAVVIEPAPCDLIFVLAVTLYLWNGLQVSALTWPVAFYLLIYNMGGFISFLEVSNNSRAGMFVITSAYMAVTAMFISFLVARDPVRNVGIIKSGWIAGAVIASVLGIAGYFNVAGLAPSLAPMQRAQGLFKDPNVLSTFLIPPALLLIQDIMLRRGRRPILGAIALLIIVAAWFLAFSRGAWISLVAAAALMVMLTFILTPSPRLRSRIVLLSIAGTISAFLMLFVLVSLPVVREIFVQRFALVQYYDAGETGRFGIQLNSVQYLLQRPLGFGPTLFRKMFGADPHNVYLNAFASYGWAGGISYFMLVISTILIGFKSMLIRTPWQHYAIAVYCGLFTTILQGVQIDTDHWRHFYWSLGMVWGMFAAGMMYAPSLPHAKQGYSP
jgi:hypothetical protein